jgi:ribosomal protein S18 acetylase RimI-like enzyme
MIKQATINDLDEIAIVHTKCFPNSFSTALGYRLLKNFYYEYISEIPELFLLSVDEKNSLYGFCMGYYMEKDHYMKSFLKHNMLAVGLMMCFRLVTGDRRAWKKLKKNSMPEWKVLNHEYDDIPNNERGDLLSICVLSDYRGCGIANDLIAAYQEVLKNRNRKLCMLSVAVDNARGIRFYEKNGFKLYREAANVTRTYFKQLEE